MSQETTPRRLNPRQAAAYLGVSLRTLYTFPIPKFKRGRVVRFDTRDLDLFLELNKVGPTTFERAS
jgi:Helix-turn-helix domain